jgi:Fe-S cluster biogenesis protein NfuA
VAYNLEILKSENKDQLVISSNQMIFSKRIKLDENSELDNYPVVKQLFFLPFVKSVILDKHLIIIEKLDFLEWSDVQEEVLEEITKNLNNGMSIYTNSNLAISIYAERTPNPRVMKFVSNKRLVNNPHEFKAKVDASNCPIASALFMHEFISEIYIDFNFISVSLKLGFDWENHIMNIREFILSYIKDGNTIINQGYDIEKKFDSISLNELDETSKEIAKLIDEQIKPAVAQDGGNIVFQSFDKKSGEVKVLLQGACSGCPSSTVTLKNGIETMLKNHLPDKINSVTAING